MSDEVDHAVHSWLKGSDTDLFCNGRGNLVKCWDKCLNKYGDYVEKQLMYTHITSSVFSFCSDCTFSRKKNLLPYFLDNSCITVQLCQLLET
jgi:hypothetical protein